MKGAHGFEVGEDPVGLWIHDARGQLLWLLGWGSSRQQPCLSRGSDIFVLLGMDGILTMAPILYLILSKSGDEFGGLVTCGT